MSKVKVIVVEQPIFYKGIRYEKGNIFVMEDQDAKIFMMYGFVEKIEDIPEIKPVEQKEDKKPSKSSKRTKKSSKSKKGE